MVYVITGSAQYTVLSGDDYAHGMRVGEFHIPFVSYVAASIRYAKEIYLDWQGTYFSMFLQALLSPINNFGMKQLQIVMVLNALLFFATLFSVVWTASGIGIQERKVPHIRLTIFTIILFSILDANVFAEIFFWYSGAVSYSMPFSFALLAVTCFLLSNHDQYSKFRRGVFTLFAVVLIFLASGGSLTVSGTGCYILVLLTVGFYLVTRKVSFGNLAVTAAGIVGAFINVAAPGNFLRHAYNTGENHMVWQMVQAAINAVKVVWGEIERMTKETMFGVMIITMFIIGIYLSGKLHSVLRGYGVISVLALASGYVTVFPVALGYGGSELPNRCYFILDVVLVLSMLNFAVFIGICLDRWAGLCEDRSVRVLLYVILFGSFLFAPERISDSAFISVAQSKHRGVYEKYYDECNAVYDYLEQCPEEDVVVAVPAFIENFACFYLDEDADGWVNVSVAEYYHKNSVRREAE